MDCRVKPGNDRLGAMPTFLVHDLSQAEAALKIAAERGVEVTLLGRYMPLGALVFREMVALAAARYPEARFRAVLDCGADPGYALNALRHGIKAVRLRAPAEVRRRVADIAAQLGAELDEGNEPITEIA